MRVGRALDTLPLLAAEGRGPFDLIFIDADKQNIPEYFAWALRLSRRGSLIIVDNVVRNNADHGVTWVHSYVNPERTSTFCVYDAPTPEAIRKVADRNGLPVGRITQVSVLDHFREIERGVVYTNGLVFFASVVVLFVLLNVWSLESRRYT